jgi:hypothetical protein
MAIKIQDSREFHDYSGVRSSLGLQTTHQTTHDEYSYHQNRSRTNDFLANAGPRQQRLRSSPPPSVLLINRFRVQVPAGAPFNVCAPFNVNIRLIVVETVSGDALLRLLTSAGKSVSRRLRAANQGATGFL